MLKNTTDEKKGEKQLKWKDNGEGEWKCSKGNARKHCLIEKLYLLEDIHFAHVFMFFS